MSSSARTIPFLKRLATVGTVTLSATSVCFSPALTQTASHLTDESFAPPPQALTGAVVFSGAAGLAPPEGADQMSIRIEAVEIDGPVEALGVDTDALSDRLVGRRIPVSEIFLAAGELEESLVSAGFVLARVVLPQQTLTDGGTLRLMVVDGFVEAVDTESVPAPVRGRIAALTDPLLNRASLRLRELERQLLLAGDTYGVSLSSALSPGSEVGGTVIKLDPSYRSVTGYVGADNVLSEDIGDWSLDAGIELNGHLGFGEALYGRISGAPEGFTSDRPSLRTFALGGVVPIGSDGLTFNAEISRTDSTQDKVDPVSVSRFDRISARLFYPWTRSRTSNITSQVSFDFVSDTQDIDTGATTLPVHEDALRVLRLSGDAFWLSDSGVSTELGASLSFGLDVAGSRTAADASAEKPLSREGADATFKKLELTARQRRALSEKMTFTLSGRAQTSFGDPLVVSEQFGIATSRELSPFADTPGSFGGDSGAAIRSEVSYAMDSTIAQSIPYSISPYFFLAAGQVHLENPAVGEEANIKAQGFGLGLDLYRDFDPAFSNANIRIELGRGTSDAADRTSLFVVGSYRF